MLITHLPPFPFFFLTAPTLSFFISIILQMLGHFLEIKGEIKSHRDRISVDHYCFRSFSISTQIK